MTHQQIRIEAIEIILKMTEEALFQINPLREIDTIPILDEIDKIRGWLLKMKNRLEGELK